jgi:membrane protein implicated in regulation of membrane protease activity
MNKIILNIGLLFFFFSVIFFAQRQLPVIDVLFKSFAVFFFITLFLTILSIVFIKSINKKTLAKSHELKENLSEK